MPDFASLITNFEKDIKNFFPPYPQIPILTMVFCDLVVIVAEIVVKYAP